MLLTLQVINSACLLLYDSICDGEQKEHRYKLSCFDVQADAQEQLALQQALSFLDPAAAAAAVQLQPLLGQILAAVQAGHDLNMALAQAGHELSSAAVLDAVQAQAPSTAGDGIASTNPNSNETAHQRE